MAYCFTYFFLFPNGNVLTQLFLLGLETGFASSSTDNPAAHLPGLD